MAPVKGALRIPLIAAGVAALVALGGCATDGRGYGGVEVGYGSGGWYDPWYGRAGYGPGGYGGWYDGYYYPGGGYYVYDRGGRRHRWNDGQRAYWQGRHGQPRQHDRADGGGRGDGWRGNARRDDVRRDDGNPGRRDWTPQRSYRDSGASRGANQSRPDREAVRAPRSDTGRGIGASRPRGGGESRGRGRGAPSQP